MLDGEVVIAGDGGLQFEALLLRIHPAASRVQHARRAVAGVVRGLGPARARRRGPPGRRPQGERRARLESRSRATLDPPVHLTPATTDRALAADWFDRFEGAGLDGVIAKRLDGTYQPGKRAMLKIKHQRTADCAVAGFRWHKNGPGTHIGSLLLGLFDDAGTLHHVGVTSSFTWDRRAALAKELEPLRENALEGHPWERMGRVGGSGAAEASGQRLPGATSRWNRGKDLSWEPLRLERVAEVAYDHLQGDRFRHGTTFQRWRPDKQPADCRYDQLEETAAFELAQIFGGGRVSRTDSGGDGHDGRATAGRAAGPPSRRRPPSERAGSEPPTARSAPLRRPRSSRPSRRRPSDTTAQPASSWTQPAQTAAPPPIRAAASMPHPPPIAPPASRSRPSAGRPPRRPVAVRASERALAGRRDPPDPSAGSSAVSPGSLVAVVGSASSSRSSDFSGIPELEGVDIETRS